MTASLFPLSSFISVSYDSARSFPSPFFRFFSLRFRVYSSSRPLCSFFLRIARSLFLPSCSLDFSRRHYPPSFSAPFHHLSFFCLFFCIFFLFFSLFSFFNGSFHATRISARYSERFHADKHAVVTPGNALATLVGNAWQAMKEERL